MSVINIDYNESAKIPENTYNGVWVTSDGKESRKIYFTGDVVADYAKAVSEHPDAMLSSDVDHFVMDSKSYRFNSAGRIVRDPSVKLKPKLKQDNEIDFTKLKAVCVEYIEAIGNDESMGDAKQYAFEEAMKMFYGKDVFDWVNSKT